MRFRAADKGWWQGRTGAPSGQGGGRVGSRTRGEAGPVESGCGGRGKLNTEEKSLGGSWLTRVFLFLSQVRHGMFALRKFSGVQ